MAKALRHITLLAAVALALTGCTGRPAEEQEKGVLTFEQVKAVEPSMLTTDEITRLVKSDTTHNKVVYFFDILCKPCLEHLRNELAAMYANRDTALWRFYLVAGFNVEDTLGNIVHFAKLYRDLLPSLGYDMNDVYMHYNPTWEHTDTGVFTPWAKSMFHSDHPFRCQYEGSPQLFIADRHGRIALDCIVQKNKDGDTTDQYYSPRCEYTLDTHCFHNPNTIITIK